MSEINLSYNNFRLNIEQSLRSLENLDYIIKQIDTNFKAVVSDDCWEGTLRDQFVEKYNELSLCVNSLGFVNLENSVFTKQVVANVFLDTEKENTDRYKI